jgi:hypothetical protein
MILLKKNFMGKILINQPYLSKKKSVQVKKYKKNLITTRLHLLSRKALSKKMILTIILTNHYP